MLFCEILLNFQWSQGVVLIVIEKFMKKLPWKYLDIREISCNFATILGHRSAVLRFNPLRVRTLVGACDVHK